MKILVIGSGGREHALCWKIRQSPLVTGLFCAPGNPGIANEAACVTLLTFKDTVEFCQKETIALVVIGPEAPLVEGWADALREAGIAVFGPSAKAAQLEGSKGFMKDLCAKYNIPTAAYRRFTDAKDAADYIRKQGTPIVVKADGLAAGKGVVVAMAEAEALDAVEENLTHKRFGDAGRSIVIEEYMEGEEISFFALCDGEEAVMLGAAQDHKRAGDGDTGPNTGGMGTYTPVAAMTKALERQVMDTIIHPTLAAMKKEGAPFQGVLFAGLMMTKSGPRLLEYNVRFGDPETQSLMVRLKSDIVPLLLACAKGGIGKLTALQHDRAALCVVMASKGYPGEYAKNTVIHNLEHAAAQPNVFIFHAGTAIKDGTLVATGGRVLGVTAWGNTTAQAQAKAYEAIGMIRWPEGFCRRDIGARAVQKISA